MLKAPAAVVIFPGMVVMYWSDWCWGWENRFYSIGVFAGEKRFLYVHKYHLCFTFIKHIFLFANLNVILKILQI